MTSEVKPPYNLDDEAIANQYAGNGVDRKNLAFAIAAHRIAAEPAVLERVIAKLRADADEWKQLSLTEGISDELKRERRISAQAILEIADDLARQIKEAG
jgi:hypothetical protein